MDEFTLRSAIDMAISAGRYEVSPEVVDRIVRIVAVREAAARAAAWDEGFDKGHSVGYVDAVDPDAPSLQRHNPYRSEASHGSSS